MSVKVRVVNRKQADVAWRDIFLAVLECTNWSLHTTVRGALSKTVTTVSLRTVHRLSLLSRQSCCEWGRGRVGRAGSVTDSTRRVFMRDQVIQHLDDYLCSEE